MKMIKLSTIGMLVTVLLLVSCQNPIAPSAATATLMPTTPPPVTEEEPIPSTVSQVPRITPQELKGKLDANEDVIVVDARSRKEYDSVHIPGALSIPLSEIEERHRELPQEGEIALYCT
jgi:3-mercaptopyruvate sulfurtransferase SseA